METNRKLLLAILAACVIFAATALPSLASKTTVKRYRMDVLTGATAQTAVPADQDVDFTVTLTNVTDGNSNFNSARITTPGFPVSGAEITAATNPSNLSVVPRWNGNTVEITNLEPVTAGKTVASQHSITLKITARTTTPLTFGCSGTIGPWSAEVFTGSSLNGDTFQAHGSTGLNTHVTTQCSVTIDPDPMPGQKTGTAFTVTVEVRKGSSVDTLYLGTISLTASDASVSIEPGTTFAGSRSFTVEGASSGTFTLTGAATGIGSTTTTLMLFDEQMECGGTPDTESGGGTEATFERPGATGDECGPVLYTLDVNGNEVSLRKDDAQVQEQGAKFILTVKWLAEPAAYPGEVVETTFDLDFDGVVDGVPGMCAFQDDEVQYPVNPFEDGEGNRHFYDPTKAPEENLAEFPWCIGSVEILPAADGKQQVTETFYGSGDPLAKR